MTGREPIKQLLEHNLDNEVDVLVNRETELHQITKVLPSARANRTYVITNPYKKHPKRDSGGVLI